MGFCSDDKTFQGTLVPSISQDKLSFHIVLNVCVNSCGILFV